MKIRVVEEQKFPNCILFLLKKIADSDALRNDDEDLYDEVMALLAANK